MPRIRAKAVSPQNTRSRALFLLLAALLLFASGCSVSASKASPTPSPSLTFKYAGQDVLASQSAELAARASDDTQNVPQLLADLKNKELSKRLQAANLLGKLKEKQAVAPLIEALSDSDFTMRQRVVEVLGEIGDERAIEPIRALLQDAQLASTAAKALGAIGTEKAVSILAESFTDQNKYLSAIAEGLAATASPAARQVLIRVLQDQNAGSDIRQSAATALGSYKDSDSAAALLSVFTAYTVTDGKIKKTPMDICGSISESLKKIGPAAVEPAIEKLQELTVSAPDTDNFRRDKRRSLVVLLGLLADSRAAAPLIAILKEPSDSCREEAASVLGQIKDPSAIQPLIEAFQNTLPLVRQYANSKGGTAWIQYNNARYMLTCCAGAMAAFGTDEVVAALVAASSDSIRQIRIDIAGALSNINHPLAIQRMNEALDAKDTAFAAGAFEYYIRLQKAGSEDFLIQALQQNGFKDMALIYYNSGNEKLKAAAKDWANKNNYIIIGG
jgi:HEAT repeat protein